MHRDLLTTAKEVWAPAPAFCEAAGSGTELCEPYTCNVHHAPAPFHPPDLLVSIVFCLLHKVSGFVADLSPCLPIAAPVKLPHPNVVSYCYCPNLGPCISNSTCFCVFISVCLWLRYITTTKQCFYKMVGRAG